MRRAYAGLLWALSGCDPTAGLADSASAAVPPIKRYFDGRGSQVTSGPWNRVVVDLDEETLYHVGARRLDDREPTFHLFGADARDGCEVTPNAGTWLMGKPPQAPFRVLPFVEAMNEQGRGRLRFTGLDCAVRDLALEDAGRPYPRLFDRGYLVPTGAGYTFADPWSGEARSIAENLKEVLLWTDVSLLWADDRLKSFSGQFDAGQEWGNAPVAVVPIRDEFLVEDADGLHRVALDRTTLEIRHEAALEGACRLQRSSLVTDAGAGAWLAMQAPCGAPQPSLVHVDATSFEVLDSFELPFEADPRDVRALSAGSDDEAQPPPVAYLTDVADDGYGKLWIWRQGLDEAVELGERARLDSVYFERPDSAWEGAAQVHFRTLGGYLTYDWIHFRWDGTLGTLAERVVRNVTSGELLVDFDGVAGNLPRFDDDGYTVLARGVPPSTGQSMSYVGEPHYARVVEFDGESGTLRLGTDPGDPRAWSSVGRGVRPESPRFAWFMPAVVFIERFSADTGVGALVAYNYELDARATIAEGVSSFDLTSYPLDGVVYAVPGGAQPGIWFSRAK